MNGGGRGIKCTSKAWNQASKMKARWRWMTEEAVISKTWKGGADMRKMRADRRRTEASLICFLLSSDVFLSVKGRRLNCHSCVQTDASKLRFKLRVRKTLDFWFKSFPLWFQKQWKGGGRWCSVWGLVSGRRDPAGSVCLLHHPDGGPATELTQRHSFRWPSTQSKASIYSKIRPLEPFSSFKMKEKLNKQRLTWMKAVKQALEL